MINEYLNHPYRILRGEEAAKMLGKCPPNLYSIRSFPKKVRLAPNVSGWKLAEVLAYLARKQGTVYTEPEAHLEGIVYITDLVILFGLTLWETKLFVTRPEFPKKVATPEGVDGWKLAEVLAFIDRIQEAS